MPTYDYECPDCGHKFEYFQQMTDNKLTKCPECGSQKLKRLIGAGMGIIFKGSGFYETDYKRKEKKPATKSNSQAGKKVESNTEPKAPIKTEKKSENTSDNSAKKPEKDKK